MVYKYAFKDYDKDSMARSAVSAASVSTKHCIEIANVLRGKKVERAKTILIETMNLKKAIPFLRFNKGIGHKRGIGPGRYPVKACTEMLGALNTCEANAQAKGLNTSELKIIHISTHMASRPWHYGRARRRRMKRTHIEIVLEGIKNKAKKVEKPAEKETANIEKPVKEKPKIEKKDQPKTAKQDETKPKVVKKEENKEQHKNTVKSTPKKKVTKDEPKKDTVSKD